MLKGEMVEVGDIERKDDGVGDKERSWKGWGGTIEMARTRKGTV